MGTGWPKEALKVEGESVTLVFEMRSGREHNTPDRAIWGFKVGHKRGQGAESSAAELDFSRKKGRKRPDF
jgi:E3 ubiquitin-protein ligase HECTD4